MIFADIKGKTYTAEDILTSNCIGLLSLLPPNHLISFLSRAVNLEGKKLDLSSFNEIEKLDFWPYLSNVGEPDVLCILKSCFTNQRCILIIECKHGAGKSGYGVGENKINDQLSKYYIAATKNFSHESKKIFVIYLTHHRCMPKDEIMESISIVGGKSSNLFYWLSWFHLYEYSMEQLTKTECSITANIYKMLKKYLEHKGYQTWQSWYYIHPYLLRKYVYKRCYYNALSSRTSRFYLHKYIFDYLSHVPIMEVYNGKHN